MPSTPSISVRMRTFNGFDGVTAELEGLQYSRKARADASSEHKPIVNRMLIGKHLL
jgi:hypothetical protein